MQKFIINFANIHCDKCEGIIRNVVSRYYKISDETDLNANIKPSEVIFKLENNEVTLYGNDLIDFHGDIKSIIKVWGNLGLIFCPGIYTMVTKP